MLASQAFGGGRPDVDGQIRKHSIHQMLASKAFGWGGPEFDGRIREHSVHQMLASKAFGGGVPIPVAYGSNFGGGDVY